MMLFTSFSISFLFTFISVSGEQQALIFNRFTRSLLQLPTTIPEDIECGAWATACPAQTPQEEKFVKEYSFTKNALFVRHVYDPDIGTHKAFEVNNDVCSNPLKISLVYNVKSLMFQIGFEIYYHLKDDSYFHIDNFQDFKSPEEVASSMPTTWNKKKNVGGENYRVPKNAIGSDVKELWFNKNKKIAFNWISLMKFKFDFTKKILTALMYCIGPNSRWPVDKEQCEDYSLGIEFYENVDENIYDRTAATTFTNLKPPSDISEMFKSNQECFTRWSIVPMSQFRFGTSSAPLCSKMSTIPIWKHLNMEDSLKKIDRYLYALYRVIDEPLHIIAGTEDEIKLPRKNSWGTAKSTLFLDEDKKILPVPRIIYKIVEYRIKDCKLEDELCWYSAVIVIHNEPNEIKSANRLCSKQIAEMLGWNELTEKRIYVCPRNKSTKLKSLGSVHKTPITYNILKLSEFPISNDGGVTITQTDVRGEIKLKFEKFSQEGDDLNNNGDHIREMPNSDDEFEDPPDEPQDAED